MKFRLKEYFKGYDSSKNYFDEERIKRENPKYWAKLKHQFDVGRQIIRCQLFNGLEILNERILRMYLDDFSKRLLNHGPGVFPSSYNVLEPFFELNHHNSVLQLLEEEESYSVSQIDFLEFVTSEKFDLENIDLYENIPEKVIFHFSFSNDFEELSFSSDNSESFYIGGMSIVRRDNQVSILMQAGESYNAEVAAAYFADKSTDYIKQNLNPRKKELRYKFDSEEKPKVINYPGRNDLWLHSVALLVDIDTMTIDIRHVARDENVIYSIITDDMNAVFGSNINKVPDEEFDQMRNHNFKELEKYNAVFDFAQYCLALPYYVYENEDRIVEVTRETNLKKLIPGIISKRKYKDVPSKYKHFSKQYYYLESNRLSIPNVEELDDSYLTINRSGYWKQLNSDEKGFDKKGNPVIGKTWVEKNEALYIAKQAPTKIKKTESFNGPKSGVVYIMRQPSHHENIFKIGLTRRSEEIRRKELSNTSNPDSFFVINSYPTSDCVEAEKLIHEELRSFRVTTRREYFRCDLNTILEVCENVVSMINEKI